MDPRTLYTSGRERKTHEKKIMLAMFAGITKDNQNYRPW